MLERADPLSGHLERGPMSTSTAAQTGCSPTSSPAPEAPPRVSWIAVCVVIGSFAACGTDNLGPAEEPVAAVTISPARATMAPGGSVQLTAVAKSASGTTLPGRAVTWSTADTAVAKVSATGLVTGVALGSTAITATSEQRSGTANITVNLSSLPVRGLYVQFERRGWPAEYSPGQVIQNFDQFDAIVGSTVAAEVGLQLDTMRRMGVNAITYELRSADPEYIPGGEGFPTCNLQPVLGLRWPEPTSTELQNLLALFDLAHAKGMRILLRLTNTHMEEQPPTNSATWLGAILGAVKLHPALELVLFEGNTHFVDTNGDGTADACGTPAEPPLWLGPTSVPAQYVQWAIGYARSLSVPARKLSAEAIVGDFFVESEAPAGPEATDGHLWKPIAVLKGILDNLGIPDAERTYALSFYEHRKCTTAQSLPCVDADPASWAEQTLQGVLATIGSGSGARVVAPEMGLLPPVEPTWSTDQALESLIQLFTQYGVDGGAFWRWTSFTNPEDADPSLAQPVKRRGVAFTYNAVKDVLMRHYTAP